MSKRNDKHDMAEDYLARIKWEGEHPYMPDGNRPDIPNWKYKPEYRKGKKPTKLAAIIGTLLGIIVLIGMVFVLLTSTSDRPGVGIVVVAILFSMIVIFYFMARDLK